MRAESLNMPVPYRSYPISDKAITTTAKAHLCVPSRHVPLVLRVLRGFCQTRRGYERDACCIVELWAAEYKRIEVRE